VVVQAQRTPTTVGGASVIVLPIDSLRTTPGAPLEDLLREMPFVLVRQNSRGEAELSIRGSDSRQAAVLFDGVPITLGWDSRSDPSVFPLSGAGSIVLVRGLSSLLLGPNTLGGVIELGVVSDRAQFATGSHVALRAGVDQLGGQGYQVDAVRPWNLSGGQVTLRAGAGLRDRAAVPLSHRVRDPYSRDRDERTNSDLSERNGYLALRYGSLAGAWVGTSLSGYALDRGVMPELHIQAPRFWRYPDQSRLLAMVSSGTGRRRTPFGSGDMEFVLGTNASSQDIESYLDADYDSVVGTESGTERTTTARFLADHSLGRGELRSAFTLATVRYDEQLNGAAPVRYRQRLWSSAVEVEQPLAGFWRASAGWSLDGASTPETGGRESLGRLSEWGGRLGLSTLAFGSWRLHASASRRARFAALRELYSGALDRFEPNPTLRPEMLTGMEVGTTLLSGGAQLQAVVFRHRLQDAIVRITQPDGRFKRINRDEIRSVGVELLASGLAGPVRWSADAMLQRVRLEDPGLTRTERRPENQPEFQAGTDASFSLGQLADVRLSVDHSGTQYCVNPDLGRNQRLAPQTLLGAGLERGWSIAQGLWSRVVASLQVDNVTDGAVWDQCGLPQAGRTLRFGIALQ
jgi:iron complex outermembrane receptor protein